MAGCGHLSDLADSAVGREDGQEEVEAAELCEGSGYVVCPGVSGDGNWGKIDEARRCWGEVGGKRSWRLERLDHIFVAFYVGFSFLSCCMEHWRFSPLSNVWNV